MNTVDSLSEGGRAIIARIIRDSGLFNDLTQEVIRYLLIYDSGAGQFWWRNPVNSLSRVRYGQRCGWKYGDYTGIYICRHTYLAHRLAWLYTYGQFPDREIDHINRDKRDNRIINLRLAEPFENRANRGAQANNKSGYKGVSWSTSANKWTARIRRHGKVYVLGSFDDIRDAARAYDAAARHHFGEFAYLNGEA